jgi:hypothetical protein
MHRVAIVARIARRPNSFRALLCYPGVYVGAGSNIGLCLFARFASQVLAFFIIHASPPIRGYHRPWALSREIFACYNLVEPGSTRGPSQDSKDSPKGAGHIASAPSYLDKHQRVHRTIVYPRVESPTTPFPSAIAVPRRGLGGREGTRPSLIGATGFLRAGGAARHWAWAVLRCVNRGHGCQDRHTDRNSQDCCEDCFLHLVSFRIGGADTVYESL